MRSLIRTVSWALLFAALGAAAASWFTPAPELEADDAGDLARVALARSGVASQLSGQPVEGVHETEDGDEIDAWIVDLAVDAGGTAEQIELRVQRSAGRVIYVDDRVGPDDAERLLSQEQFEALGAHRDDRRVDRWALRNVLAAVSAVAVAGTCYVLATRSEQLWSTR